MLDKDERQPTKEEQKQRVVENQTHPGEKQSLLQDLMSGKGPKAPTYEEEDEG